jgi:hypothetical protein
MVPGAFFLLIAAFKAPSRAPTRRHRADHGALPPAGEASSEGSLQAPLDSHARVSREAGLLILVRKGRR